MLIAQKLKKQNIIEYLLYMWQIEDLIRACQFDIDMINQQIIQAHTNLSDEDQKGLYGWYESLIDMMKRENVQTQGHLQLNQNIIIELNELHEKLLHSGKDAAYPAKFYHVLPFIVQLRKQQGELNVSDIEICFNFLYGILMLKMKKNEISAQTLQAQEEISKFLVLLARNYNQYKAGNIEID